MTDFQRQRRTELEATLGRPDPKDADLLLRHSGANHKRETISFSKRRQENGPRETTAMVLGLLDRVKTTVLGTCQTVHCCRYAF